MDGYLFVEAVQAHGDKHVCLRTHGFVHIDASEKCWLLPTVLERRAVFRRLFA